MGCTHGKTSMEARLKSGHDGIVIEIALIVEELEEINQKYCIVGDQQDQHLSQLSEETLLQLEQFLWSFNQNNSFISQKDIAIVFQEIYIIFKRIQAVLTVLQGVYASKSNKLIQTLRPEINQVYVDFIELFEEITPRILYVSSSSFDNHGLCAAELSLADTQADSIFI